MSKRYLIEYLDDLVLFIQKIKEKQENDTFSYYKKIFSYLKAANSNLQAVYEGYITEALNNDEFAKLQSVFLHSARIKMLPEGSSGYDHCDRLWGLLDLLACDDFDNVYRILPEGLSLSTNGYSMYIHGTNILLCLLYNSENATAYPADKIIDKAEKFAISKKALWERSVISCLLGILQCDVSKISDSLQQVCDGFTKTNAAKYMKMQCQNAYGLMMLAKHFLSEEKFAQIIYPECKNFSKNYMSWLLEQDELSKDLCVTYDSPMEELNEILKKQIAITCIHQPYLNSANPYLSAKDKKAYYMDFEKMLAEFIQ
ncbi:MAG: hypothetical protein HDR01_14640 [Lachnospiraceae bacterium]|nr:hypothetical protein [Lachnospiraceae bacterium]